MVTPVHRFQPIESVAGGGGGFGGQHGPRRFQQHHLQPHHHNHRQHQHYFPPAYSGVRPTGAHVVEFDSSVYLDPIDGVGDTNAPNNNHQLEPQLMTVGCMKCGMWTSFALGALFIGGAKFYLDEQRHGLEVLVFSTVMVVVLLFFCILSMCRSKETRDRMAAAVTSSQAPHSVNSHQEQTQVHEMETASSEDTGLGQIIDQSGTVVLAPTSGLPQGPDLPPPYDIAIQLPHQMQNIETVQVDDESPPPSYDKAVS